MLAACSRISKITEVERAMLLACGAENANPVVGVECFKMDALLNKLTIPDEFCEEEHPSIGDLGICHLAA